MDTPVLRHGVDVVEIERIRQMIIRHNNRFLARIYTPVEITECKGLVSSLAARFAAKEAVAKALGTGIGEISWHEIEICRADTGAPILNLYGSAAIIARNKNLRSWAISLSHTQSLAIASVVAFG